jgi:hypothetical protein
VAADGLLTGFLAARFFGADGAADGATSGSAGAPGSLAGASLLAGMVLSMAVFSVSMDMGFFPSDCY